jgi:multicomponent Na+:H+ antiporter subunit C
MTDFHLYGVTAVGLLMISSYALLTRAHLIRRLLALNIMGSSVFLLLVAVAHRNREEVADPVPHAMVLTGIVVAAGSTGLAMALIRRLHAASGLEVLADATDDNEATDPPIHRAPGRAREDRA